MTTTKKSSSRLKRRRLGAQGQFNLILDRHDRELLERLMEHERLNRSDVLRRLIRDAARRIIRPSNQLATG